MQPKILNSVCSFLLLFTINLSYSQEESIYQQELNKMVRIPNSPEAMAFEKYGDIDVSLYSGTPNIGIPLYAFKGREMDIPISLSYDASGVKVEQLATWVGLGWNLSVGGRISRVANGLADDYIIGDYATMNDGDTAVRQAIINQVNSYLANTSKQFSTAQEVRDYFVFLDDINKNFIDAQPDIYKVSAPGLNTTIVFDINDNNTPKSLDNPRILINNVYRGNRGNNEIIGWEIINEDGTKYTFGSLSTITGTPQNYEVTKRDGSDENFNGVINNEYVSSWLLTKVESPNKKDIFEFNYFDSGYWDQPLLASSASKSTVALRANTDHYTINEVNEEFGGGAGYWISQQFISSITHNQHLIASFDRGLRTDIAYTVNTNTRLSDINIFDYSDNLIKQISFQNDTYFNDDAAQAVQKRLKLSSLEIKDATQTSIQNYFFEYDRPDLLPTRLDKGQDFAGFYNGADNTVLFERYESSDIVFEGANRTPNSNMAKIGMLKTMVYPTGGYTEFNYEGNFAQVDDYNDIEVNDLHLVLSSSDPGNEDLYLNSDGSIPDDKYLPILPKMKRKKFRIEEGEGPYEIKFSGSADDNDVEFYIIEVNDDFIGSTFSEYLTNPIAYTSFNKIQGVTTNFEEGWYLAIVLLDEIEGGTSYGDITLNISHKEPVVNSQNIDKGGLRIESIKNYESTGNFSNGKTYEYIEQEENYRPNISEIKSYGPYQSLVRTVSYPRGDEPIITYPKVREYRIDELGNSEGYVEFEFYKDIKGLTPYYLPPYENNYYPSLQGGNVKKQDTYDLENSKNASKEVNYFETSPRPISVNGLIVFYDDEHVEDFVYIRDYGSYFMANPLAAVDCSDGVESPTFGVTFCNPLPACSSFPCGDNFVGLMDKTYGGLDFRKTFVNGAYGGVSVSKESYYYDDLTIETESETVYEPSTGFYFPKETISVDSDGNRYRQTATFAGEDATAYPELFEKNRLVEVVASTTEKIDANDNVLEFVSANKKEYYSSGNVVLPSKVFTSKEGTSNLEERLNFTYYPDGNLKESQQMYGPSTTYIWGYDNMYLVAKIENATYTEDVAPLDFSTTVLQDLTTSDFDKKAELNKIRTGLSTAMVTSYTYKHGVGLTSITDPKNYATFFEYDAFNRLKETKDNAAKMLQEHRYSYRSNTYVPPQGESYNALDGSIQGESTVEIGNALDFTVNPVGGSGDFSHTWYVNNAFYASNTGEINVVFNDLGSNTIKVEVSDNVTGENVSLELQVNVAEDLGVLTLSSSPLYGLINTQQFTFNASGVNTTGSVLSYEWTVDNGSPESFTGATGFQTSFSSVGEHTVKLKVTEEEANTAIEDEITVELFNPLAVSLASNKSYVLTNGSILFTPSELDSYGTVYAKWSIVSASGTEVLSYTGTSAYEHTFSQAGNYEVTYELSATQTGQVDLASVLVMVTDGISVGNIAASTNAILANEAITFTTPTISGGSGNYSYTWKVNGTTVSTSSNNLTYSNFPSDGSYSVSLEAVDNQLGVSATNAITINVYSPLNTPNVSPDVVHMEKGDSQFFNTSGVGAGSGSYSYSWYIKYGSGSYSRIDAQENNSITYDAFSTAGTYTMKFRVTDTNIQNHYRERETLVNVYELVTIANSDISTPSPVAVNTSTYFNINTASGGSGNFEYEWDVIHVNTNYTEAVGTFSEANRNYSGFFLGPEFTGSTKIQCRVWDLITGNYTTVFKTISVSAPALSGLTIAARDSDPDPETATYGFNANNVTGGSGTYNYRWIINGTIVQEGSSNNYQYVYLNCSNQSETVTCVAIDLITGEQIIATRTVNLGINCGG